MFVYQRCKKVDIQIVLRANHTLRCIRLGKGRDCPTLLCTALVCPHLEVWVPQDKKHIKLSESI